MGSKKKHIDEWEKETREQLDLFVREYRRMHEKRPREWPLTMHAGDWDEQFSMFDGEMFEGE